MGQKRYHILDGIRGFAIVNMIAYHAIWDLVYLYGFDWQWYLGQKGFIWQQGICWTFIIVSGFCQSFGRHKLKRGLTVFFSGCLVTVVTWIVMPEEYVRFGILTLLGSCALLMIPGERILKKWEPVTGFMISIGLFMIMRNVNRGFLGFAGWNLIALPENWYCNWFSTYLGFMMPGFVSSDYFSLFPWLFLFLAGYFLQRIFDRQHWMHGFESGVCRPLEWLGRHSLMIYLLHQVVLYLLFALLFS